MSTSKEYKHARNVIHNDLGINEKYIKDFTEKYIEKSIDKVLSEKIDSNWMENLIIKKLGEIITSENSFSRSSNKGVDYIKGIIKEAAKEEIVSRINFKQIGFE